MSAASSQELSQKFKQLSALAVGLCKDAGVRIRLSPSDWSWNPVDHVLSVSNQDLEVHGIDYCAGLIAHEVGHYFISRYFLFKFQSSLPDAIAYQLFNAIEDPRSDNWICSRYSGAKQWQEEVRQVYASYLPQQGMPDILAFISECAREPDRFWQPDNRGVLSENVVMALDKTRSARQKIVDMIPPVSPNDIEAPDKEQEIARLHQILVEDVWPSLKPAAVLPPLTLDSVRVLISSWQAFDVALQQVLPYAEKLLDDDVHQLAKQLAAHHELIKDFQQALAGENTRQLMQLLSQLEQPGEDKKPTNGEKRLAREILLAISDQLNNKGAGANPDSTAVTGTPDQKKPVKTAGENPEPYRPKQYNINMQGYEMHLSGLLPQVNLLVQELERFLAPQKRLREKAGYPTGYKIDLRQLMGFEADPRLYNKLWRRKNMPDRRETAFSLLIDCSGSMNDGKKDKAAMKAAIIMAETLSRLKVAFEINGFQDKLIELCSFGSGLNNTTRRQLTEIPLEMRGERKGGHNCQEYNDDGPCLEQAASRLQKQPCSDRVLMVISDGLPEGRYSGEDDLRTVIKNIESKGDIYLIGLGLGEETGHVTDFYTHAKANIPIEKLGVELLGILRSRIQG